MATLAFRAAVRTGNLSVLRSLTSKWRSRHPAKPPPFQPLLPLAAKHGHPSTLTFLLQNGAYVDPDTLEAAFSRSLSASSSTSVLRAILDSGWDINSSLGHVGSILTLALDSPPPVISFLLDQGADPNINRGSSMHSVLDQAASFSDIEIVDELLRHGAKLKNTNALKSAAYTGRTDMIEHLLAKGIDVNEIPDYPEMLNQERQLGLGTALHEAARNGQVEAVRLLLDRGANPRLKNTLGSTALDLAKETNHTKVVEVLSKTEKAS